MLCLYSFLGPRPQFILFLFATNLIECMLEMCSLCALQILMKDFLSFQLAGNYVKNIRSDQITALHVKIAMHADPVSRGEERFLC